jgi:hypothetical protein
MSSSQIGQRGNICKTVALLMATLVLSPRLCTAQHNHNAPPPPPAHQAAPVQQHVPQVRSAPTAPAARPNSGGYSPARPNTNASPAQPSPGGSTAVRPNNNGYSGVAPNHAASPGGSPMTSGNTFHPVSPANRGVVQPSPGATVSLHSGGTAQLRPNGQLRSIDRNGAHITYGTHGVRTVVAVHNGARVVSTGAHTGYVQRQYLVNNGHTYVQRTYVVNNVTHTVAYRAYTFRGAYYYGYAPAYYYHPAFYAWAYSPWRSPVYWSWGWNLALYPWYGYYSYYFTPYPAYASPANWLTDYLISQDLQAAYAAGQSTAVAANNAQNYPPQPVYSAPTSVQQPSSTLSPEVKQAITEQVKMELAADQSHVQNTAQGGGFSVPSPASSDVPPALDPASRTFVVDNNLDVAASDQECTLTPGDVIVRLGDTPDQDQKVAASVTSSKKADCPAGKQIAVSVEDLQEMQNHFREQLDSGLKELAAKQGTGGLPKAPDSTLLAGEVPPPAADTTAAQTLQDQEIAADQTQRDAARETSGQGAN